MRSFADRRPDPLFVVLLQVQRAIDPHELVLYRHPLDASVGQSSGWRYSEDERHQRLGWTEKEELILVNRLLRDDPTKGDLNNRTAVSFKETSKTIVAPDLLPIYIVRQSMFPLILGPRLTRSRSVYAREYRSNRRQTTSR